MLQIMASLTGYSRGVIYHQNMFIVQANSGAGGSTTTGYP